MASPPAISSGAIYHIFNRGNNREDIFVEERNYPYFLERYTQTLLPIAETYAFCLLRNHFHLLVRVREHKDIVAALRRKKPGQVFGDFFNGYAKAINSAYQRTGSLFQNPFGRVEVKSDAQFIRLITYIHRNPQKHGFVKDFRDWPHSSYPILCQTSPTWLAREVVLALFGDLENFKRSHEDLVGDL